MTRSDWLLLSKMCWLMFAVDAAVFGLAYLLLIALRH